MKTALGLVDIKENKGRSHYGQTFGHSRPVKYGRQSRSLKHIWQSKPCYYCGLPATAYDHISPYSLVGDNTQAVPVCQECNVMLSCKMFKSVAHKGAYICLMLPKRHRKLIKEYNFCKTQDLGTYGPGIRNSMLRTIRNALLLKDRIEWAKQHYGKIDMPDREIIGNYVKAGGKSLQVVA